MSWQVEGAQREYFQALKRCVNDPNASPGVVPTFLLDYKVITEDARTPEERHEKTMELLDMALEARNLEVKRFLFNNSLWTPDRFRQSQVLSQSASSIDDLTGLLLDLLAAWNKDTLHVPEYRKVGSDRVMVNKKDLLEYWKRFLGGSTIDTLNR